MAAATSEPSAQRVSESSHVVSRTSTTRLSGSCPFARLRGLNWYVTPSEPLTLWYVALFTSESLIDPGTANVREPVLAELIDHAQADDVLRVVPIEVHEVAVLPGVETRCR